jgi:hypothetical protein
MNRRNEIIDKEIARLMRVVAYENFLDSSFYAKLQAVSGGTSLFIRHLPCIVGRPSKQEREMIEDLEVAREKELFSLMASKPFSVHKSIINHMLVESNTRDPMRSFRTANELDQSTPLDTKRRSMNENE